MIPKIIWQTYEVPFNDLPQYIKDCAQTWKDHNPEWEYKYMDAKQRDEFVLNNFDEDWYKIFIKLPYGVLKADIWRHMVLYVYGGVYADLDCICKTNIEFWLKDKMDSTYFIDEDLKNFCQFVFGSVPNNKVNKKILQLIKDKLTNKTIFENLLNKSIAKFEEEMTGNVVCTEAIRNFFGISDDLDLINNYKKINDLETIKQNSFFYYGKESYLMIHDYPIKHLAASSLGKWTDGYIQWQKQDRIKENFL